MLKSTIVQPKEQKTPRTRQPSKRRLGLGLSHREQPRKAQHTHELATYEQCWPGSVAIA